MATPIRRRVDGEPSARALLLSVLGQYVIPNGGSAWTSTLVEALGALGVEPGAARQALSRTAADGWLTREPHGRLARWTITPSAQALLAEAWRRLERSLVPAPEWDGQWLVLTLLGPVGNRNVRRRLAARLAFEGFGTLGLDVWVSADQRAIPAAEAALEDAGLTDNTAMTVGRLLSPPAVAFRAWDIPAAEEANHLFLKEFAGAKAADDREAFVVTNRLAHRWREVLRVDPVLPAALLPADWAGFAARKRFVQLWETAAPAGAKYYAILTESQVT